VSIKDEIAELIKVLKVAKKFHDSVEIDVVLDELNKILGKEKTPESATNTNESNQAKMLVKNI